MSDALDIAKWFVGELKAHPENWVRSANRAELELVWEAEKVGIVEFGVANIPESRQYTITIVEDVDGSQILRRFDIGMQNDLEARNLLSEALTPHRIEHSAAMVKSIKQRLFSIANTASASKAITDKMKRVNN